MPRLLSSHIWTMPDSPSSTNGELIKTSLRSKKVVVLAAASAVGLFSLILAACAVFMARSTSSKITIGTGLLARLVPLLAPTKLRNPAGYFFFLIVEPKLPPAPLPEPASLTFSFSRGHICIIGSSRSFEKDSASSSVGSTNSMERGLTSIVCPTKLSTTDSVPPLCVGLTRITRWQASLGEQASITGRIAGNSSLSHGPGCAANSGGILRYKSAHWLIVSSGGGSRY